MASRNEAINYNRMNMYGSAAPKIRTPEPKRNPNELPRPRVVKKTRKQIKAEQRMSAVRTTKVLAICAVFFVLIAFQIYSQVKSDELDRELQSINSQIEILDSENTRLNMQLDSIISLDKVDAYARDNLGMVKVENYQVSYVDLSSGDIATVSGGKVHHSLWDTIKSYFS
ncbi:MAG: hypothetical protein PUD72_07285 [Oscillospiraceae bacterium]|nr:hypothetical protein [Oscillospiraceae bacterium]